MVRKQILNHNQQINNNLKITVMKELLNNRFTMTMIIVILTIFLYVALGTDNQDTIHEVIKIGGRSVVILLAIISEVIVFANHED